MRIDMDKERLRIQKIAEDEGLTRKQISEKYKIPYSRVQYALRGMDNIPREPSRGGPPLGTQSPLIEFEGEEIPRTQAIRILSDRGWTISDIAEQLNVAYPTVYTAVKRFGKVNKSRPQRYAVVDGQTMKNADAVRYLYRQGLAAKDISERLNVAYNTVYNIIRKGKTSGELD